MLVIVITIIVIALLYVFAIKPEKMTQKEKFTGYRYAHRGLHDDRIPENSMAAIALACEKGYGIEFDVHLSADDIPVVFHDSTLGRMCGEDADLSELTARELANVSLKGTDEYIPLLSEVLECVGGRVPLIIELKTGDKNTLLCEKVYEQLRFYTGVYCVESFHPSIVIWFKKHAPHVVRGQLSGRRDKSANLSLPVQLLLQNMLLNIRSRPHFIAYNLKDTYVLAFKVARKLWKACCVAWTVKDEKDLSNENFDMFIFEGFKPGKPHG